MKYKNVLIYTTHRTGSSFLDLIIKKYRLVNYDKILNEYEPFIDDYEPFCDCLDIGKVIDDCDFHSAGEKPVVIKLMHDQLCEFTPSDLDRFISILKNRNFYIISLSRKNIKEQILSYYIACMTGEFGIQSNKVLIGDYESFVNAFQFMINNIKQHMINQFNIPVNQKLFYEDIIGSREIILCDDLISLEDKGDVVSVNGSNVKLYKALPKNKKLENLKEVEGWYADLMQNESNLYLHTD